MGYDAVVFDMDGVLVEPTPSEVLRDAARETFRAFDVPDPDPAHLDAVRGGTTVETVREIGATYGVDPEVFWHRRETNASLAQRASIYAGAKPPYADVDVLSALDRPLGVVSSNQERTVAFALSHHGLDGHFETAYGRELTLAGIERKKPNTHYLEAAFADLGVENPLFVGDSEVDVRAAANAGVDSAFVRRPHRADYDLSVDPTHEIESLRALADLVAD